MKVSVRTWLVATLVAITPQLTSCFLEVDDDPDDEESSVTYEEYVPYELSHTRWCDNAGTWVPSYKYDSYVCRSDDSSLWLISKTSQNSRPLPVYVHYMLTEDLGSEHSVNVEAFDNPRFAGNPIAAVRVSGFNAQRPGEYSKTEIYLPPGTYYLRAYLANDEETVIPYSYEGMELMGDTPVGLYGALSSPQTVVVKSRLEAESIDPVSIYLDKLFKKAQADETKANLRILFEVAEGVTVPDGRKTMIRLHKTSDFAEEPVFSGELASDNFLVQGRTGKAEYVANNLPIGSYLVFAFIDEDGNGFFDEDEVFSVYSVDKEQKRVEIKAKRTETISMKLEKTKRETPTNPTPTPAPVPVR